MHSPACSASNWGSGTRVHMPPCHSPVYWRASWCSPCPCICTRVLSTVDWHCLLAQRPQGESVASWIRVDARTWHIQYVLDPYTRVPAHISEAGRVMVAKCPGGTSYGSPTPSGVRTSRCQLDPYSQLTHLLSQSSRPSTYSPQQQQQQHRPRRSSPSAHLSDPLCAQHVQLVRRVAASSSSAPRVPAPGP